MYGLGYLGGILWMFGSFDFFVFFGSLFWDWNGDFGYMLGLVI